MSWNFDRLAFVPARAGSKRVPRKNLKMFAGKPMITWPLIALHESKLFDHIFVSTDDPETAQLAQSLGAITLDRNTQLADDFTHTTEVLKDAISNVLRLERNPWVYMVYPTAPATAEIIREFVTASESHPDCITVSISKAQVPVQRSLNLASNGVLRFREPKFALSRTQDLDPVYFDAGKMYGGRKSDWLETETPLLSSARGFELPDWLSVDLDTVEDWEFAEYKFRRKFGTN